jgi:uncharacterized 2Fe-2S/4Fe-4S cluster protein (DUF4445 family)
MPTIEFQPAGRTVEVSRGTGLLEAAREAGVEIELPCAGEGTCGRCVVRVTGEVASESAGRLPEPAIEEGYVLACTATILDTPLTVEVPDPSSSARGQFAEDDTHRLVDHDLLPSREDIEPVVVKWVLQIPPAQLEDGLSDLDRVAASIRGMHDAHRVSWALPAMRTAACAVRGDHGRVTVTAVRADEELRVIQIEAGDETDRHFGAAVDLGTTSVAVQLVDLNDGEVLATRSDYNHQISCGDDVISRINYASRPERLDYLRARAVETINRLLCEVAFDLGANPAEIAAVVVSGNTVMTHLLLGLPPEHIRLEPYTPTVLRPPMLTASDLGLGVCADAPVLMSPCVGSYVGGDITAGLLCTDLAVDTDEISLFIDIGTNGEIVIGNAEFLMTCACSAGPAFEGGGIGCGMRASAGAVERVDVDPETGKPTCTTIGDEPSQGICGSGMIDLLANLLRTGWIDRMGELDRSRSTPYIEIDGKRARYLLVPAKQSGTGREIAITETEIENIIRAKAAIYSAAALMLERMGLAFTDLSSLYIAGSFGRFLDLDQAKLIGMVPDLPNDRFRYVGNASLTGSYMALVSDTHRRRQLDIAKRITNIELSTDASYMDQYTAALFLPHTDLGRFPEVAKELEAARQERGR